MIFGYLIFPPLRASLRVKSSRMESVSVRHVIFAASNKSFRKRRKNLLNPCHITRKRPQFHIQYGQGFPLGALSIQSYRQSDFQDFQGYAKRLRLSPATELKVCSETLQEKVSKSFHLDESQSLFKVKLQTSNSYGSGLSNIFSGILLCVIDANGDSVLQRIPVMLEPNAAKSVEAVEADTLHFQRGSIDEFTFKGPTLGRIEALWISVESGQWRLAGVSLTVIEACQTSSEGQGGEENQYTGFQYEFEIDDVLLGEASDTSMVELRPCLASELSGTDLPTVLSESDSQSTPLPYGRVSKEESMREYTDLKLSLLSYDATIVLIGATVINFSVGENAGLGFFIGGVFGFLYLLLLQRSVDDIPASPSSSRNVSGSGYLFGGLKSPISSFALAIGISFLAVKYSTGDAPLALTAKELLAGMMGFLACKVAVVLAAFKPITLGLKENE